MILDMKKPVNNRLTGNENTIIEHNDDGSIISQDLQYYIKKKLRII